LRRLFYKVATKTSGVGELEKAVKWGQASYITSQTKSGSTIRIDAVKNSCDKYAMYFHCQTTLVDTFKEIYRDEFIFEGNRALIFDVKDKVPVDALSHCIEMALTYYLNKKKKN
jgi:hypothetical protein